MHMWILLGLRREETEIHVISVKRDEAEARRLCDEALALLSHHCIPATDHPITSKENVASLLNQHLPDLEPRLIVMGAFGRGGLRAHFFGDNTRVMIKECPYPLFLHR